MEYNLNILLRHFPQCCVYVCNREASVGFGQECMISAAMPGWQQEMADSLECVRGTHAGKHTHAPIIHKQIHTIWTITKIFYPFIIKHQSLSKLFHQCSADRIITFLGSVSANFFRRMFLGLLCGCSPHNKW